MTEILKNRKIAAVITAVLCLLLLLLGMNRSVSAQADKYTQGFYEGVHVTDGGYTSAALYDILNSCSTHALTLSSIYADCDALDQQVADLTAARRSLVDAMEDKDIPAMYAAKLAVETAADALAAAAAGADISGTDSEKSADAMAKLSSAMGAVEQNPYNEYIKEYYSKVENTLPMRIFGFLVFAEGPEFFALEEL